MNLLDSVRATLGEALGEAASSAREAAHNAREIGQNLSAQAQSQIGLKKLQIEHAKALRDLGEKTFAWHQSGQMIVTGRVPADVQQLCREIEASSTRLQLEEARLEEFRQQATQRAQNKTTPATYAVLPTETETEIMNNQKPETETPTTPKQEHATQKLSADVSHADASHIGVVLPGTSIVTNPTTATTHSDMPLESATKTAGDAQTAHDAKTADGDAPIVPLSDLGPSPQGDTTIGGGAPLNAPGNNDTLGGGGFGSATGGATM